MSELIKIAASQLGVHEIKGAEDNPVILNYAKEAGIYGVTHDEVPWCSIFINWCAFKAGLQMSNKANARSWLHVGKETVSPIIGDLVIFWRESPTSWKGHVAIFMGMDTTGKSCFVLGANQNDSVSITSYSMDKVIGFRKLSGAGDIVVLPKHKPLLMKGSNGSEVKILKEVLTFLGYDCGIADEDFDMITEVALKMFQANHQIEVDGVFGKQSKDAMQSALQT